MNEGTGMKDDTGMDEQAGMDEQDMNPQAGMDPQDAAAIMGQARERARRELTINRAAIFASWSLVYLLGYGVIWLSVRGQRPYMAPAGWAIALVVVLAAMAVAVTAGVTDRATSGVGGASALRRRLYGLSLVIGVGGTYVMEAALRHAGASVGVIGVFGASAPLLVSGVVVIAATADWHSWYSFGLGCWLVAVAGGSGFAGPVGVWAVDALAVGVSFLAIGAVALAANRA